MSLTPHPLNRRRRRRRCPSAGQSPRTSSALKPPSPNYNVFFGIIGIEKMPSIARYSFSAACSGSMLVLIGSISFIAFFYSAVVSKLLPSSNNRFISAIQKDRYYCFLVPLTLPLFLVAVYFHWLSMKLFKHA